jgi:hypothetical protein
MKLSAAHGNAVLEEVVALRTVLMAKDVRPRAKDADPDDGPPPA